MSLSEILAATSPLRPLAWALVVVACAAFVATGREWLLAGAMVAGNLLSRSATTAGA